ncbi:MAG: HAD family hydrolase, partial [Alphaproteobacteria bacterium]
MAALAEAIGFDLAARRFRPESPVIAGTPEQAARCLMPALPEMTLAALVSR